MCIIMYRLYIYITGLFGFNHNSTTVKIILSQIFLWRPTFDLIKMETYNFNTTIICGIVVLYVVQINCDTENANQVLFYSNIYKNRVAPFPSPRKMEPFPLDLEIWDP